MTSYNLASLPNPGRTSAPASAGIIIGAGGITPTGTIDITENGTYDVTQYASADVNVSGGGSLPSGINTTVRVWENGDVQLFVVGGASLPLSFDTACFMFAGVGSASLASGVSCMMQPMDQVSGSLSAEISYYDDDSQQVGETQTFTDYTYQDGLIILTVPNITTAGAVSQEILFTFA